MSQNQAETTFVVDGDSIIGSVPDPRRPLDTEVRVTIGAFKSQTLVNLRYWTDYQGNRNPTKRGIAFPANVEMLRNVAMLLEQAANHIQNSK